MPQVLPISVLSVAPACLILTLNKARTASVPLLVSFDIAHGLWLWMALLFAGLNSITSKVLLSALAVRTQHHTLAFFCLTILSTM
jgi:hypothetical protein